MENKTTKPSDGSSNAVVQDHKADSQILLVDRIKELHELNPDYAKSFIDQAEKQADFRRNEEEKESLRIFITKSVGQFFALLVGLSGLAAGCFIAYTKPEVAIAGAIIAAVPISGLAVAFIRGHK